jgi:HD-GYP domain-containing protein (c-di-GMP phosphodiesterase class II)
MTTDRSYRKARSAPEAAAELLACAGTHFDPRVVDTLLAVVAGWRGLLDPLDDHSSSAQVTLT